MDNEFCTFLLRAEERMYQENRPEWSFLNIRYGEKKP